MMRGKIMKKKEVYSICILKFCSKKQYSQAGFYTCKREEIIRNENKFSNLEISHILNATLKK